MPDFNRLQRSRLRLSIWSSVALIIVALFPMGIIIWAAMMGDFHLTYPWIFLGIVIGEIGAIIAFYVKKESDRPSFVNNTVSNIGFPLSATEKKIMDGEDKDDADEIPL